MVVAPCFTVKVTEPLLIAGPLAGVTVALSVTDVSPYVAVALVTAVVVSTAAALRHRVSCRSFEPGPLHSHPAPLLVPSIQNLYVPDEVDRVDDTLRHLDTPAAVTHNRKVPTHAVAAASKPVPPPA